MYSRRRRRRRRRRSSSSLLRDDEPLKLITDFDTVPLAKLSVMILIRIMYLYNHTAWLLGLCISRTIPHGY